VPPGFTGFQADVPLMVNHERLARGVVAAGDHVRR
jgi:hypothetical protein